MAIGYPDFFTGIQPAISIARSGQTRFQWLESTNVSASSISTGTVYTVPTGKRLYFTGYSVSCDKSLLQEIRFLADTYTFYAKKYDVEKSETLPPGTGYWLEAGVALKRAFYNWDSAQRSFLLAIYGVVVDV